MVLVGQGQESTVVRSTIGPRDIDNQPGHPWPYHPGLLPGLAPEPILSVFTLGNVSRANYSGVVFDVERVGRGVLGGREDEVAAPGAEVEPASDGGDASGAPPVGVHDRGGDGPLYLRQRGN